MHQTIQDMMIKVAINRSILVIYYIEKQVSSNYVTDDCL